MLNNIIFQGTVTYITPIKTVNDYIELEFGLSMFTYKYNNFLCKARDDVARKINTNLNITDMIIVLGELHTINYEGRERPYILVKSFQPVETKYNLINKEMNLNLEKYEHLKEYDD